MSNLKGTYIINHFVIGNKIVYIPMNQNDLPDYFSFAGFKQSWSTTNSISCKRSRNNQKIILVCFFLFKKSMNIIY